MNKLTQQTLSEAINNIEDFDSAVININGVRIYLTECTVNCYNNNEFTIVYVGGKFAKKIACVLYADVQYIKIFDGLTNGQKLIFEYSVVNY